MNNQPILSIIVPTYNRSAKVVDMAQGVLKTGLNVELVVVDNCSAKEHVEHLQTIDDPCCKLILREKNIGGLANPLDALNYSSGVFTMLCLDKDYVDARYLGEFVEFLAANPDLVYGQCALNATQTTPNQWFNQGFDTLLRYGYDCHHPSGFFARTETMAATGIVAHLLEHNLLFPFNIDIIKAHLTMQGKGCYLNSPLVQTETLGQLAKEPSHTYSGDNVWFLPHNIFNRMMTFAADACMLGLNSTQQRRIIAKLYQNNLNGATFGYKRIIGNENLCAHHALEPKKIGIGGLVGGQCSFARSFLRSTVLPMSKTLRIFVVLYASLKWSALLILKR